MWELGVIAAASVWGCKCAMAGMSVKAKVANWYLEFAKLDGEKLRMLERLKVSRVNQERLRNLRLYVLLPFYTGLRVIIQNTDVGQPRDVVWSPGRLHGDRVDCPRNRADARVE